MADDDRYRLDDERRASQIFSLFPLLTDKQHEVLSFIAENRTSKEIAWDLRISESAVNQRIEAIRARTGSPPRAELARAYRHFLAHRADTCNPLTGQNIQLLHGSLDGQFDVRDGRADTLLAEPLTIEMRAPWQGTTAARLVPEALDGRSPGLSRIAAMIAIAGGLLTVAIVGLSVVETLSGLL